MFGRNLFLSDKIVEARFCDCEDECLRDRWRLISKRFVLHFEYVAVVFCRPAPPPPPHTHTFVLERLLSCVKTPLIANMVSFKTLSRST